MENSSIPGPSRWPWVVVFLVTTLTFLGGAYAYYTHETEHIRQEKYQELAAIARLKAGQIVEWRKERLTDAGRSANGPFFRKALAEWLRDPNNNASQKELLDRYVLEDETNGDAEVVVFDVGGQVLVSVKPQPQPLNPTEKQTVEEAVATRTALLSNLYRSSRGNAQLDTVAPVLDQGGKAVAVVVMRINADSLLYPLIQSWPTPSQTSETLLVRREGDALLFLNELRHWPGSALSLKEPLTRTNLPAVQAVLGKQGMFHGRDYRGVEVLADLRSIPDSPWFMVAKVDAAEILAEARYRGFVTSLFAAVFILLAAGVTAYGYRHRQARLYQDLYESERQQCEAQEKFRTTLYSIGDAVITTDVRGLVEQMNTVAERLTGWSEAEAKGKPIDEVFHIVNEESRELVENPVQHVLREGVVVGLANHTLLICRDGTERPIADSGAPIRDGCSTIFGVVMVFRDQTEARAGETALEESEKRYRNLFEKARDSIMIIDLEGDNSTRIVAANSVAAQIHGYEREELLTLKITDLDSSSSAERVQERIERILRGEWVREEVAHRRKDGSVFPVEISAGLIEFGNHKYSLAIERDITERKQAEEALKKSDERSLFLASAIELSSQPFAAGYIDGTARLFNRALCNLTGYTEAEMERLDWNADLTPPEYREFESRKLAELARTGEPVRYEKECIRKDGSRVPVELLVNVGTDENGNAPYYYAFITDLTERKRSEEALRESEQRYRTVADFTYNWEYWVDQDGKLSYTSPSCERITGYSAREFLDDPRLLARIVHPDDLAEVMEHFHVARKIASESSYSLDFRIVHRNGQTVWINHACRPVHGKDGQPLGRRACNRDITDRKRAELEQKRLVTAVEQAVEAIVITDVEGNIEYANPSFERITGYTREEVLGEKPSLFQTEGYDEAFYQNLQETLFSGRSWAGRLVKRRKDGTQYEEDVTISPVRDSSGTIINFVAVKRDISREVQLQKQLIQAQKMEAIGTLAGGIAHDFNNLLQITLGYSELLLSEKSENDPDCADLKHIFHAARSGADLVRGLLTFSRKVEPKVVPMSVNHEVRRAEKFLSRTISRMIDIRLELAEDLWRANADPAQVQQIIMNLAVNARDAMGEEGSLTIRTENVTLDEEYCRLYVGATPGACVLLSVSDTGHGMDRETLSHIFEPFYTTKGLGTGTGLGLAMVYGIVKQHGGHVTCYSEVGKGTSFKIYLPAILTDREDVALQAPVTEMPPSGTETVLLVDDETAVRHMGERILTKSGYSVLTGTNGAEAVELYRTRRDNIDLVILDLMMPTMGGKECLKELLKIDPQVRVIVASGYSAEATRKECIELGAKGFVSKPYGVNELLQQVRKSLDES